MAKVEVSFTGPVRRPKGVPVRGEQEIAGGGTLDSLLTSMGYSLDDQAHLRAMVDGHPAPLHTELAGGEKVVIFMPVGGG